MDAAMLIRTTREGAGLSQGAQAARAGTSQPAVSRYESGASSPSVETLDRLLAAMGGERALTFAVVAINSWNRLAVGLGADVTSLDGIETPVTARVSGASVDGMEEQ